MCVFVCVYVCVSVSILVSVWRDCCKLSVCVYVCVCVHVRVYLLVCGGVVAKDNLQSCSLLSILFESGGMTLFL